MVIYSIIGGQKERTEKRTDGQWKTSLLRNGKKILEVRKMTVRLSVPVRFLSSHFKIGGEDTREIMKRQTGRRVVKCAIVIEETSWRDNLGRKVQNIWELIVRTVAIYKENSKVQKI